MADLVLLTPHTPVTAAVSSVLPGLTLLPHTVHVQDLDLGPLLDRSVDLLVVDALTDLIAAHTALRTLVALDLGVPVLTVLDGSGLAMVDARWPTDDVVLHSASPAEVAARVRLLLDRAASGAAEASGSSRSTAPPETIRVADVVVDEASWSVRAGGVPLDLTFKEFELLRHLVHHPGRVMTRDHLLHEVWGRDFYGGSRTVDVHIRRLRAKLGPERESLIGTIRGVGYRFNGPRTIEPDGP